MRGSLAFDFPDQDAMSERRVNRRIGCSGVGWVLVAGEDEIGSIAKMLAGENGYRHFFLASRNGRRCVSEGDIVMLALRTRPPAFEVFVCGAATNRSESEEVRNLIVSGFANCSVALHGKMPIEMLIVGLSPFGQRERRRQESRTMLERTFDSLQCKQIIGNPYLKERLSRAILAAAPKPIDPLVNAIFSRLRADALLGAQHETEVNMGEAAILYRSAKSDFETLELTAQAAECSRRMHLVGEIDRAKGQEALPGFKKPNPSVPALSDLGFVAKRCIAMRIDFRSDQIKKVDFERREQGTSRSLGEVLTLQPDDMLRLLEKLEDPISAPVVEPGMASHENGALMFDLNVRIRQRFAAGLGFDVPMTAPSNRFQDGLLGVSGKTCRQVGHPSDVDEQGNAKVRLAATRSGKHRVQLRVSEGLISRQFPVTFQLDPTSNG